MFFIGQEVECIDPTWGCRGAFQRSHCPNLPEKGKIYHVRWKSEMMVVHGKTYCMITLQEIWNPTYPPHVREPCFFGYKYRPIYRGKSDIKVFTDILAGKKATEDA